MKLLSISMVGAAYKRGVRVSGWCHAFIEGESKPRYYSEEHAINSIIADLKTKGVDTAEFEAAIQNGSNWKFRLTK